MSDVRTPLTRDEEPEELSYFQVKLRYGMAMLLIFVVALIFRAVPDLNIMFEGLHAMNSECHDNKHCLSGTLTLRLSFSLFVFYTVHFFLSLRWMRLCFGEKATKILIEGAFFCKLAFLMLLVIMSLFIPFSFFKGFAYLAFAFSVIFLIIQAVMLLDFAYCWNERWVPADGWDSDEDGNMYKAATICATFTLFATGVTLCGLSYKWFAPDGCPNETKSLHLFFITFTLCFGILATLASAAINGGSILISSFAFAYCTILTFSALNSGSQGLICDEIWSDPSKVNFNTIISLVIAAVAVIQASTSASTQRQAMSLNSLEIDSDAGAVFPFFFFVFALGACYCGMTLVGWRVVTEDPSTPGNATIPGSDYIRTDVTEESMWVKMSTVWLTMILFVWALVAPVLCGEDGWCCRDRTF